MRDDKQLPTPLERYQQVVFDTVQQRITFTHADCVFLAKVGIAPTTITTTSQEDTK